MPDLPNKVFQFWYTLLAKRELSEHDYCYYTFNWVSLNPDSSPPGFLIAIRARSYTSVIPKVTDAEIRHTVC